MLAFNELYDVAQIVAVDVEMLLRAGQRQTACGIGGEITEVPTLDEAPKVGDAWMCFKEPKVAMPSLRRSSSSMISVSLDSS